MKEHQGKKILIIGGSTGIGLATAKAFAQEEALVTIASRSQKKLDHALEIAELTMKTECLDITNETSVKFFFKETNTWDHIVISAADTPMGSVKELDLSQAYSAMNSKFWGAYHVARSANIKSGGSLTLISGYLSERPRQTAVLQGAINAAIDALARGLALELAPVRVNSVSPGLVATSLWSNIEPAHREQMYLAAADRLPVGRVGKASDIAKAILFLASTGYVTGSKVLADGGATIAY
ncbi:SDR family oxidoreductase [Zooshikella harenae]|uniref:SDR family oxidoreductase n=1 Tax=Zooshikella harenae TaxID=2827238 RepID=A0ABS5ZI71_9GAMM|nr:SDR family oxidoreductase [Zooshikella harenae]MBU2713771.1 SDR family oxidoreductase [Zooshikella harenae]